MAEAPFKRTKVLACGSNVFNQIPRESKDRSVITLCTVKDAASVVAVCTCQTVILSLSGKIKVLGEGAKLVEQLCRTILDDEPPRRHDQLILVGQDMFEAILDVRRSRCYLLQYGEEADEGSSSVVESSTWKTAAVDGRGRCMAIDDEGQVYLFDSVAMFRDATGEGEDAVRLRNLRRFGAHEYAPEGSSRSATPKLPKFQRVSAGNAHFVLLIQTSEEGQENPVWLFGDARFGAVPLQPFNHTTIVDLLPSIGSSSSASNVPTDISYLMPVPHFSTDQGFPSRIGDAVAGARHTLVLTTDGDLYGWGWNEDSCLVPFADSEAPEWEDNIVYEPKLLDLPSSSGKDDSVALSKVACSNGRSFGITTDGQLVVAGSNEFECLGIDCELEGLPKKPRFEREFSQIKKPYDCVNGFQLHPSLRSVLDVHATSLATFITVETE